LQKWIKKTLLVAHLLKKAHHVATKNATRNS
jgi:hypothetical protein